MYVPHLVYALAVGGNFMVPALLIGSCATVNSGMHVSL